MQLRDIEYMVRIADTKNFTRAAEQLFISQSALSQAIQRLEGDLGVKLFNREPSEITLTYAGKVFYEDSQEILKACNKIQAKMSDICDLKCGVLSISVPRNYSRIFVSRVIPVYRSLYPGIELHLHEGSSSDIEEDCRRGVSDIGILSLPQNIGKFKYVPLFDEPVYICLPASHPIAVSYCPGEESPTIDMAMLKDEQYIMLKGGQRLREQGLMLCQSAGFKPNIVFETVSVATVLEFARNGLGIGFVTETIRRHSSEENVRYFRVLFEGKPFIRTFAAIYMGGSYLSRAAAEFIRIAKETPM